VVGPIKNANPPAYHKKEEYNSTHDVLAAYRLTQEMCKNWDEMKEGTVKEVETKCVNYLKKAADDFVDFIDTGFYQGLDTEHISKIISYEEQQHKDYENREKSVFKVRKRKNTIEFFEKDPEMQSKFMQLIRWIWDGIRGVSSGYKIDLEWAQDSDKPVLKVNISNGKNQYDLAELHIKGTPKAFHELQKEISNFDVGKETDRLVEEVVLEAQKEGVTDEESEKKSKDLRESYKESVDDTMKNISSKIEKGLIKVHEKEPDKMGPNELRHQKNKEAVQDKSSRTI
jgi:hypothetical protein